ncbi:hypothetical protein BDZ89DRAFT_798158 [Hymenopellis radicata]|nr:hypothetical protein BDZ89DRAFT_798158 [Hymenopellis radicata]
MMTSRFAYTVRFVSLNYRLATFEFLASGEIVEAGNDNLALKDLSIGWHYTEFASFTGVRELVSNTVTIRDESTTAYSVAHQSLTYNGQSGAMGLSRGGMQASYDDIVRPYVVRYYE